MRIKNTLLLLTLLALSMFSFTSNVLANETSEVEDIILKFANQVKQDVLALSVKVGTDGEFSEEFNLNDRMLKVSIKR